jgi:hypothetical protein
MGVSDIPIHTPSMTTRVYNKPAFQNIQNTIFFTPTSGNIANNPKKQSLTVISLSNILFRPFCLQGCAVWFVAIKGTTRILVILVILVCVFVILAVLL